MQISTRQRPSRAVAIWLLVGVGMIIIQILLGGITRLTGSGLSITEWKPIMGTLPPMNEQDWSEAFKKYQEIAQYKYLNTHYTLQDFKFIFFWEWLHRLWARLIGVVFLIPFAIFLIRGSIRKEMVRPLIILFLLGALQGLVGWIMVQSGLENSELLYVSHYKLAIHFILALGLLVYTLWFALDLLVPRHELMVNKPLRKFAVWIVILLLIQMVYGAFMAGLKAAVAAPTWPLINGEMMPGSIHSYGGRELTGLSFLADHPLVIHFVHRNLAYIISILILVWCLNAYRIHGGKLFQKTKWLPLIIVLLQVLLGILTVMNPLNKQAFLWLGVAHQFFAMVLLLCLVWILYLIRNKNRPLSGQFLK